MNIDQLFTDAQQKIKKAINLEELENVRIEFFGRKQGKITQFFKNFPKLSTEEKKTLGPRANKIKSELQDLLEKKTNELSKIKQSGNDGQLAISSWQKVPDDKKILSAVIDPTAPGTSLNFGHLHPLTQVLYKIIDIFTELGYKTVSGPEMENEYYNFDVLNFPPEHPARDTMDTFYLRSQRSKVRSQENKKAFTILRTHTSTMQGRVMEKMKPPLRILVPGKCYRHEAVDASHGFEFWQVEGFVVDKNIYLTDLFGTIEYVLKKLFGDDAKVKFACTYFPFVEPGVDVYLQCTLCQGKGCSFCKNVGWSEIMPAGMIHPKVLTSVGYNPNKVSGFAFAIGLSRVVNLLYAIDDLRILNDCDLRILQQF